MRSVSDNAFPPWHGEPVENEPIYKGYEDRAENVQQSKAQGYYHLLPNISHHYSLTETLPITPFQNCLIFFRGDRLSMPEPPLKCGIAVLAPSQFNAWTLSGAVRLSGLRNVVFNQLMYAF